VRIVVSSNNGKENVDAFAQSSGFAFDLVLGFGEGLAKGAPHITRAEEAFQIGRGEMMFIGDSLHDGEIAAATGIPFVGLAGDLLEGALRPEVPAPPRGGALLRARRSLRLTLGKRLTRAGRLPNMRRCSSSSSPRAWAAGSVR
jgi:hypothetical protein